MESGTQRALPKVLILVNPHFQFDSDLSTFRRP